MTCASVSMFRHFRENFSAFARAVELDKETFLSADQVASAWAGALATFPSLLYY